MKATRTDPGAEVIISGEVRAEETSCSDTWSGQEIKILFFTRCSIERK